MKEGPDIARVAALIGDPARANMLTALMSGKALTATELAGEAGVTLQTASAHLAKLADGNLLRPRKQGRHKYFALANEDVAAVLESMMGLAANAGHLRTRTGPKNAELRRARVCYNHLAGDAGTRMFDSLVDREFLRIGANEISLTDAGAKFFQEWGIDLLALDRKRSRMCVECLDWSERRSHLGGALGREIFSHLEAKRWISRDQDSRVVRFSRRGKPLFKRLFYGVESTARRFEDVPLQSS